MTKSIQAFRNAVRKLPLLAVLALAGVAVFGASVFESPVASAGVVSPAVSAHSVAVLAPTQVFAADNCPTAGKTNGNGLQCLVDTYVTPLVQLVSALVGLATVISIVVAGIQYSSSADDPSKVQAAKTRITRSIIAFIAFIFLFAFLQWILPGGLMNGTIAN